MKRRTLAIRVLVSLAVSAVFVAISLRNASFEAVASALREVPAPKLFGYMAALTVIHLIRAVRWQSLLQPLGRVSFGQVNAATALGYMLLALLPLRLGELARPILISRAGTDGSAPIPRSGALASCVVERVVDSLAAALLAIISLNALAAAGGAADYARHAAALVSAGFGAICCVLALAYFRRDFTVELLRSTVRPFSPRIADRLAGMAERFILGLHLGSPARVLGVISLTCVHWCVHVLSFWVLAPGFGFELTAPMAATVLASQVVGSMIPAGPGMLGTTQFFIQLGLSIFYPDALTASGVVSRAVAFANTVWILQFAQQVVFGLPFLVAGHLSLRTVLSREDQTQPMGTRPP